MIPSLRLDYTEIDRRCRALKAILDEAHTAAIGFSVDDGRSFTLALDLRHRSAHASGGLVREPGTAGNLPSGETYIVPYEGELDNDPSQSQGLLPVDLDGEVVVYRIERNTAVSVESSGPTSEREQERLIGEPAYGNMAELGLGLLADFGVEPVGEILLDEKLAPHIAFGRSDHFGGQVGAAQFSAPEAVVHIDRVYQPRLQPRVQVARLDLLMPSGAELAVVRDGHYVIQL
jgi:leucyl aminopeptidase (aminopeptidase T)